MALGACSMVAAGLHFVPLREGRGKAEAAVVLWHEACQAHTSAHPASIGGAWSGASRAQREALHTVAVVGKPEERTRGQDSRLYPPAAPNNRIQATGNKLRSCLAPLFPRA